MVKAVVMFLAVVFVSPLVTPPPFNLQVVDETTGRGIPNVRITSDNGIVCYTYGNGLTLWSEYSLMGRTVRFDVQDHLNHRRFERTSSTMDVYPSGHAVLRVRLKN
jgi:hypothetical protein